MPQLVCVGCHSFLKIKKNGVAVEELMPNHAEAWVPYKLWLADLYGCERCGIEVIAGFGAAPVAEHYMKDYAALVESWHPLVRVDDCMGIYGAS